MRRLICLLLMAFLTRNVSIAQELLPKTDVLATIEASGDFAPMFPFRPTHAAPDNITNVATWSAGSRYVAPQGFLTPVGEFFVDETGRPIRFIGTNLGIKANFPEHAAAERLAEELTRYGINLVRVHYSGHKRPAGGYPVLNSFIDPVQLERLDYLIAQLKKRGIFVDFTLNIARHFGRVNGFVNAHLLPYYKNGIDNIDLRMIQMQKQYHSEILNHVNPYTGMTYKDDPTICLMELANENSIIHSWFSAKHKFSGLVEPYKSEIITMWNNYLRQQYGDTESLRKAWSEGATASVKEVVAGKRDLEKGLLDWPYRYNWSKYPRRAEDFVRFLSLYEYDYFIDLYHNTKQNLGVRQPLIGTQVGYGFNRPQALMDYCDMHGYWCHPAFPGGKWNLQHWNLRNSSITNSYGHPGSTFTKLARSRIFGKPFTVSEYDHPNLNFYCAEGNVMLLAMASFQNWAAVMHFAWILDDDFDRRHIWPMFDMCSAPQKLVHFPACYAMFVRADVRPADDRSVLAIGSSAEKDVVKIARKRAADAPADAGSPLLNALPLVLKAGSEVEEFPELFSSEGRLVIRGEEDVPESIKQSYTDKLMKSLTGELTWNWQDEGAGFFMVDTRYTKVFTGFVRGRSFTYRGMRLTPGKTRLDWLTLSLTLAHANGRSTGNILPSGSYLLAASGLVHNTGAKIVTIDIPGKISCSEPDGGLLGTAPVLCEGIPAQLALAGLGGRVSCYALDSAGERTVELPVTENEMGEAIVEIGPQYKTLWYELIVRE